MRLEGRARTLSAKSAAQRRWRTQTEIRLVYSPRMHRLCCDTVILGMSPSIEAGQTLAKTGALELLSQRNPAVGWWVASTGLFARQEGRSHWDEQSWLPARGKNPRERFQISTNVKICNRGRIPLVDYEHNGWLS